MYIIIIRYKFSPIFTSRRGGRRGHKLFGVIFELPAFGKEAKGTTDHDRRIALSMVATATDESRRQEEKTSTATKDFLMADGIAL